jgi:hypothetical protein
MVQTAADDGRLLVGEIATGSGSHTQLAGMTVKSDAQVLALIHGNVPEVGMPAWLGEILAFLLRSAGPKGLNFARYSIDYHIFVRTFSESWRQHRLVENGCSERSVASLREKHCGALSGER